MGGWGVFKDGGIEECCSGGVYCRGYCVGVSAYVRVHICVRVWWGCSDEVYVCVCVCDRLLLY